MDPENKVCQFILFLYSLNYIHWELDWHGEVQIDILKKNGI
jgi:hypothetical protein